MENALAAELRLVERERNLAETSLQLAAALRLSEERYRLGVGDYLTVLTSQSNLLTAESALIDARRSLLANRVDLHLALGGGFEFDFDEEEACIDRAGRRGGPSRRGPGVMKKRWLKVTVAAGGSGTCRSGLRRR